MPSTDELKAIALKRDRASNIDILERKPEFYNIGPVPPLIQQIISQ